jgi:hypothetical protein
MRDVLPLKDLTKAIVISLGLEWIGSIYFKATIREKTQKTTTFKTTLHEDNDGCMRLAKMEPGHMTPRSRHYGVKYHWFRTKLKPNEIKIDQVDTSLQKADFLMKALRTKVFKKNRKWQYFHTWINGYARMSLGKYWKMENLTIFTMCDKWEQEYMWEPHDILDVWQMRTRIHVLG